MFQIQKTIEYFDSTLRTLTGATTLGQSGLESNDTERVLHIPPNPRLDTYHQIQFNAIPRTLNNF